MSKRLVEAILVKALSQLQVEALQPKLGFGVLSSRICTGISIYKIIYKTLFKEQTIEVSGVLILPQDISKPLPVISIQNGTTFLKSEASSVAVYDGNTGYEFIAASGYITIIPDYIGYGSSASCIHPYYDQKHSASCVVDMIVAVEEFIRTNAIPCNYQLVLSGFSEGAYITLAAMKSLQQHNPTQFSLKAVAAAAGGFDLFGMLSTLSTGDSKHVQPAYIAFLILAYEHVYGWNKSLDYYFSEPYASLIPQLFDGTHDLEFINISLGTHLAALFNPIFYSNLSGNGEMELKKTLYMNTLSEWKPEIPLRLYHGTADDVIPMENTQLTYQKFLERGASEVEFVQLPNANHSSTLLPMLESAITWFDSFI